jgi:hypothetical protein
VNTTNLSYLPDPATLNEELPSLNGSNKRTIEEAGLLFPERERDGVRWRAAHVLGPGAMGRVGLWIGSNETNVIVEVRLQVTQLFTINNLSETCRTGCTSRNPGLDKPNILASSTTARDRHSSTTQQAKSV